MPTPPVSPGIDIHPLPPELAAAIAASPDIHALWESFTPLARNEWICWITSAKQEKTRQKRLETGFSKMRDGMRRPCCWPGCPHRNPKAAKYFH